MGVPGASSALAVAERYGVPDSGLLPTPRRRDPKRHEQQRLIAQLEQELERTVSVRTEAVLLETERRKDSFEREREHVLRHDHEALEN